MQGAVVEPASMELKVNDNDSSPHIDKYSETPTGCWYALKIFSRSLVICLLISILASAYIALQYIQLVISMSSLHTIENQSTAYAYTQYQQRQWLGSMIGLFSLYVLVKLYLYFLELYTTFLFNTSVVEQYKIQDIVECSSICTFLCSCLGQTVIVSVWFVYFILDAYEWVDEHDIDTDTNYDKDLQDFMNEKISDVTSITSPVYWGIGLLLSPVFILCVAFVFIIIFVSRKVSKLVPSHYHEPLLLNADKQNDMAENWRVNKKYLYRILAVHIILLFTWIIWKWLTTPFISTQITTDNGLPVDETIRSHRDNVYLSYWILFIFTTITKQICNKLVNVSSKSDNLLFNAKRTKIMISILTSILFSFGLKFVFTNVKDWERFIVISVMNLILNVFVNGSFQSHQYGKNCINRSKDCLNRRILGKCCSSKQLKLTDFDNMDEILKYNKDLALNLSMKFIISGSSCLIMMTYFGMQVAAFEANVDVKVFEFLGASFGFSCIVFLGQVIAFKKRDRKYFRYELEDEFKEKTSFVTDEKEKDAAFQKIAGSKKLTAAKKQKMIQNWKPPRESWGKFLTVCLLLAFFWIGSLTGMSGDLK